MRLFRFGDDVGTSVDSYGSRFVQVPLTDPDGRARAACFHYRPAGRSAGTWPR